MYKVKVSNATVTFHAQGEGPGLILVHGTGADWKGNWGEIIESFSPYRKVVCPNYSGSGETKDNGEDLSIEMLAEQIIAAAEESKIVPFDIMGFSLGATLTAYIAAEYPEYVNSVILVGGFASTDDSRSQLQFNLWKELIEFNQPVLAKIIMLTGFTPDFVASMTIAQVEENIKNIIENNNWDGMARQVELDLNVNIKDKIRKITKPTLVIANNHDYMVSKERSLELVKLNPKFEYAEIESGHLVVHEKPKELIEISLEFLLRNSKAK